MKRGAPFSADIVGRSMREKKEKCPAYGKKCKGCGRNNHFATVCKSTGTVMKNRVWAMEHAAEESGSDEDVLCITLGPGSETVNIVHKRTTEPGTALYATMWVNRKSVSFQLDCGASCNVIPVSLTQGMQPGAGDVQ